MYTCIMLRNCSFACRRFFKVNIGRLHVDRAVFPPESNIKPLLSTPRTSEEHTMYVVWNLDGLTEEHLYIKDTFQHTTFLPPKRGHPLLMDKMICPSVSVILRFHCTCSLPAVYVDNIFSSCRTVHAEEICILVYPICLQGDSSHSLLCLFYIDTIMGKGLVSSTYVCVHVRTYFLASVFSVWKYVCRVWRCMYTMR